MMVFRFFRTFAVIVVIITSVLASSCVSSVEKENRVKSDGRDKTSTLENELAFTKTLQKHLDAVTNRDLKSLESTLPYNGTIFLILPGTEITTTVTEFMDYHKAWFAVPDWTFETKILEIEVGDTMGMAITEIIYREPDRDGAPYFNRMIVSYDLQKVDGSWYIIKDHASSIEKSTDTK